MQIKRPDSGIAILSVMLILVLMVTLSAYLVESEHLLIRKITNQRAMEQAYQLAIASEAWAGKVLERDKVDTENDHLLEEWNALEGQVQVEEAQLATAMIDLQGRFNLNNLAGDASWFEAYKRLLRVLELDEALAESLRDWIDEDINQQTAQGAEDYEYAVADPPYRAANQMLSSVGELRWVRGYSVEVISQLRDYVTALPESDLKININTCDGILFMMMSANPLAVDEVIVSTLVAGRGEEGYLSVQDVVTDTIYPQELQVGVEQFGTVSSDYFEVNSRVQLDKIRLWIMSGIQRGDVGDPISSVYRLRGLL